MPHDDSALLRAVFAAFVTLGAGITGDCMLFKLFFMFYGCFILYVSTQNCLMYFIGN